MRPPGIPPDVVCLKGPEVPSAHVWEEREAPAETPCLCLDFKGSWALLKLIGAVHNQDMPHPSFARFFTYKPFLQELRATELKTKHAPPRAGQQGTCVVLIKQKRENLKTRHSQAAIKPGGAGARQPWGVYFSLLRAWQETGAPPPIMLGKLAQQ